MLVGRLRSLTKRFAPDMCVCGLCRHMEPTRDKAEEMEMVKRCVGFLEFISFGIMVPFHWGNYLIPRWVVGIMAQMGNEYIPFPAELK